MFEQTKTVSGSDVKIYERDVGDDKLIMGAYRSGDRWFPAAWYTGGLYNPFNKKQQFDMNHRTAMDLLESKPEQAPEPIVA